MEEFSTEKKLDVVDALVSDIVKVKRKCGFACLTPDERKKMSSLGARKAHSMGVAHKWTSAEAKIAGQIGGSASHRIRGRRPKVKIDQEEVTNAAED